MTDDIDRRTAEREAALRAQLTGQRRLARPEDYVYDKAQEAYWDLMDNTLHKEKAVDASIPQELWRVVVEEPPEREGGRGRQPRPRERLIPPSRDIMRVENDQFVESSTWWPGQPQIVSDWFIDGNGFYPAVGRRIYNTYKPIPEPKGNADAAGPWIEHVKTLWPNPAEHEFFFNFCAHMVQKPEEKCHAGVVMSGQQGIGKDSALLPIRRSVGSWNTKDVEPDMLFKEWRPWLQTLMLVVNEAKPAQDEFSAISLYNTWKPWMAAPPETLPVNDKHVRIRHIINLLRLFITTNNYLDLYIPPDDRRMFIMHSHLEKGWHEQKGRPEYFINLWGWLEAGGCEHVAAWLAARDLSAFNPKAEPSKTQGWGTIAQTWDEYEDGIWYALDKLGRPDVLLGAELLDPQFDMQDEVAAMLKSPRKIGHRMQKAGYMLVKCPTADRWSFTENGVIVRSRYAFAKQSLGMPPETASALIWARGREYVLRLAASRAKRM
jgi:hypothetical protein